MLWSSPWIFSRIDMIWGYIKKKIYWLSIILYGKIAASIDIYYWITILFRCILYKKYPLKNINYTKWHTFSAFAYSIHLSTASLSVISKKRSGISKSRSGISKSRSGIPEINLTKPYKPMDITASVASSPAASVASSLVGMEFFLAYHLFITWTIGPAYYVWRSKGIIGVCPNPLQIDFMLYFH